MSDSFEPWKKWQHSRLPFPSLSPAVCSNSCPFSCWCSLIISSSFALFSFCPQSFPNQGLFQWVSSLHQVTKILELQCQSFQWIFRFISLGLTGLISLLSRDSQESSPAPQFESTNSSALNLLYGPALSSIHGYWKNHSFDYMDLCWQSTKHFAFLHFFFFGMVFVTASCTVLWNSIHSSSGAVYQI